MAGLFESDGETCCEFGQYQLEILPIRNVIADSKGRHESFFFFFKKKNLFRSVRDETNERCQRDISFTWLVTLTTIQFQSYFHLI